VSELLRERPACALWTDLDVTAGQMFCDTVNPTGWCSPGENVAGSAVPQRHFQIQPVWTSHRELVLTRP